LVYEEVFERVIMLDQPENLKEDLKAILDEIEKLNEELQKQAKSFHKHSSLMFDCISALHDIVDPSYIKFNRIKSYQCNYLALEKEI
jgi:2'-5' RNA ligase